jgi:hypothetical protein
MDTTIRDHTEKVSGIRELAFRRQVLHPSWRSTTRELQRLRGPVVPKKGGKRVSGKNDQ